MLVDDFDYELPNELVAQEPLPRGESRLLVVDAPPEERHRRVADLPDVLRSDDLLVVNDTRVIPARLFTRRRPGGGKVELLLADRRDETTWDVLAKPGRKARPGTVLDLGESLTGEVLDEGPDGRVVVRFSEPVEPHLETLGHVPLPPYIKRPDRPADRSAYQTVFAREPGAIAAPTAGLHFDEDLLAALADGGVDIVPITLHVGLGTFKPVAARLVHEHEMDAERFSIPEGTSRAIRDAREEGRRVVAVGTTVVRALEGRAAETGEVLPGTGSTDCFIYPGWRFQVVDVLLTNFHLPKSSLLMLVCAFAGKGRVLATYEEAIERRYRFYSYGDAMLLERRE